MITHFEHKYEIGDIVFHAVEENKKGIVLDVSFSVKTGAVLYRVAFEVQDTDDVWAEPVELIDTPNFN